MPDEDLMGVFLQSHSKECFLKSVVGEFPCFQCRVIPDKSSHETDVLLANLKHRSNNVVFLLRRLSHSVIVDVCGYLVQSTLNV